LVTLLDAQAAKPSPAGNASPAAPAAVQVAPDYVIGPDDVITVVVWKEQEVSGDFTVRPDGKISMPLMNDIAVAGLTPEQLRGRITEAAAKFIEEPTVTVVVKAINSRKVYVMGQVNKPGPYPLNSPTTVIQLLATAGGLLEYANQENISIVRNENGRQTSFRFNYKDFTRGRNPLQNIELKPGDTVIVP
jgi:polysaccharide export outer membrane protein